MNLDHTIVPSSDKEEAARFFARVFGLTYAGPWGEFAPVAVNDTFQLDFYDMDEFGWHHYAFRVDEEEFDEIFSRIEDEGIPYGSGPSQADNMQIGSPHQGGRTIYFHSPDRHILEIMTHRQAGVT